MKKYNLQLKPYMLIGLPIILIICIIFPFITNNVWLSIGTTFLIFTALALSQDIILGKVGIYAMGHAMFFGIGAYTFAILINQYQSNILVSFIAAGVVAFIIGNILIRPVHHLTVDYFLVVSIGLNIIFTQFITNDPFNITGGPNGIFTINFQKYLGIDWTNPTIIYFVALIFLLLIILLLHNLSYSKIGRAIYYTDHDSIACQSVGINPSKIKIFAFSLGCMIAGMAGAIYTLAYGAISPENSNVEQSILLFAVVIVGGRGSLLGIILGSFIMFVMPEIFREYAEYRFLLFGLLMVALMIFRPNGLIINTYGFYKRYYLKHHD